jgi:hypothetical protein
MNVPPIAQDTTDWGSSREDLRVLQVHHRVTPNSPSPDATLIVQRKELVVGQTTRLTLRVKRIDSQRPHGSNQFSWSACYSPAGFGNHERVKLTDEECRFGGGVRMPLRVSLGIVSAPI